MLVQVQMNRWLKRKQWIKGLVSGVEPPVALVASRVVTKSRSLIQVTSSIHYIVHTYLLIRTSSSLVFLHNING